MCAHTRTHGTRTHTHTLALPAAWLAHTPKAHITCSCPNTHSQVTSAPSRAAPTTPPPTTVPTRKQFQEESTPKSRAGVDAQGRALGRSVQFSQPGWRQLRPLEAGVEGPPCSLPFPRLSKAGDTSLKKRLQTPVDTGRGLTWNTARWPTAGSQVLPVGDRVPVSVRRLNLQPKMCIPRMLGEG